MFERHRLPVASDSIQDVLPTGSDQCVHTRPLRAYCWRARPVPLVAVDDDAGGDLAFYTLIRADV